jgi:HAD superfamily hydrolase (TIGR01509 family)
MVQDIPEAAFSRIPTPVQAVVFDLDGTLLSTETLIIKVARTVLQQHGKQLTEEALKASIGKPPLEAWQSTMDVVGLTSEQTTAAELYRRSEDKLEGLWHEANYLPGAVRLIHHLRAHAGLKIGLATSTPRAVLAKKTRNKPLLQQCFDAVVCGDDEDLHGRGKPDPACFLKVCRQMEVDPAACVVIEDAPSGLIAAVHAGCHCIYVPSIANDTTLEGDNAYTARITRLTSLLEFNPAPFGLDAFDDRIQGTVPFGLDADSVIRIRGEVVTGFGRGSKALGIPTANVDTMAVSKVLPGATTGIFFGWASLACFPGEVYATALSIGWNPFFQNEEKTCEPWLLHDFGDADFTGTTIALVVVGWIRGEANFESMDALIARIREDGEVTKRALTDSRLRAYREDVFLRHEA